MFSNKKVNVLIIAALLLFNLTLTYASKVPLDNLQLNNLKFEKNTPFSVLSYAKDKSGNSWIKGRLNDHEIGEILSLRINSPLLLDYDLYIKNGSTFLKQKTPIVQKSSLGYNLFAHYNFYNANQEFYIDLKMPVKGVVPLEIHKQQDLIENTEKTNLLAIVCIFTCSLSVLLCMTSYFTSMKNLHLNKLLFFFFSSNLLLLFYNYGYIYFVSESLWLMKNFLLLGIPLNSLTGLLVVFKLGKSPYLNKTHLQRNLALILLAISFSVVFLFYNKPVFLDAIYLLCTFCFTSCFFLVLKSEYSSKLFKTLLLLIICSIAVSTLLLGIMGLNHNFNYNYFLEPWNLITVILIISTLVISQLRTLQTTQEDSSKQLISIDPFDAHFKESSQLYPTIKQYNQEQYLQRCITYIKQNHQLTNRESDTLTCIWKELSIKEISEELFISPSTTKYHTTRVYSKLNISNRKEALQLRDKFLSQYH